MGLLPKLIGVMLAIVLVLGLLSRSSEGPSIGSAPSGRRRRK
jgi:hypothetical protein